MSPDAPQQTLSSDPAVWEPARLLSRVLDGAGEGIVVYDRELRYRVWNRFMAERTGMAAEAVIGRIAHEVFPALEGARVVEWLRRALGGEVVQPAELRVWEGANGASGWLRSRYEPFTDEQGAIVGVIAFLDDVTAREELQTRLHQSQRIEAVGRLAGGVAHDFNNLLTVIRGNAQLLLASDARPAGPQEELEEILQAAERAATLTRQLLAFSRQQVLQPRVLDLNEVVGAVWPLLERLVGASVSLEFQAGAPLGAVTADPVQLEQVLLNLVVNARDAMPGGGRLVIGTSDLDADEDFARAHPPMPAGPYVRLTVQDTGTGMDVLTLSRAFEPFFTTKAMGQGAGMGLATVYGVVKQSGGFIWVDSAPGKGATFTIYLPRAATSPRPVAPRPATLAPCRGAETILVAEDEYLVRVITRRTLERAGYRVYEAANGEEALTIARELGERLDLLITDIVMPVMGGRELAAALGRERPDLCILFMSGYTHERDAHLSAGGGVSHFLHKPFTLDELRGRVRLLLDEAVGVA